MLIVGSVWDVVIWVAVGVLVLLLIMVALFVLLASAVAKETRGELRHGGALARLFHAVEQLLHLR